MPRRAAANSLRNIRLPLLAKPNGLSTIAHSPNKRTKMVEGKPISKPTEYLTLLMSKILASIGRSLTPKLSGLRGRNV
jgi:hypothetical protein